MSTVSITIRAASGVHHLTIDADGVLHNDASPPAGPRGPARRGKAWTAEEEDQLRAGFSAGEARSALAERFGRSQGAVTARLVHLGLIDAETAGLRYPPTTRRETAPEV